MASCLRSEATTLQKLRVSQTCKRIGTNHFNESLSMKVTYDDFRGMLGIVPTPATPDAESWQATNTVNLAETQKMIEVVVGAGIEMIATTGTFGECATLTEPELNDFVACVVETVAGRRPVFAGITTLNTRDTIRRGKALVERGADGLFIGRPMWLALDDQGIVRFYNDIAQAMPGVPLIVYDNPVAFKGKISSAAYAELAKIPEVIAAKHTGGPALAADMAAVGDKIRILPLPGDWQALAEQMPERALSAWSGATACAPAALNAFSKAILARDWQKAREIGARLRWAEQPMFAGGDLAGFMDYSIAIGHLRFQHAGLIDPGPVRPPYLFLPDNYRDGGIETGKRWAELQREFSA